MKSMSSRAIVALALCTAMGVSVPAAAYASSTTTTTAPSASFIAAQQALEAQLASRLTRLQHLNADVTAATTLSANAASMSCWNS